VKAICGSIRKEAICISYDRPVVVFKDNGMYSERKLSLYNFLKDEWEAASCPYLFPSLGL